ncbi:PepSY domain-containing protein [Thalassotalea piscium]
MKSTILGIIILFVSNIPLAMANNIGLTTLNYQSDSDSNKTVKSSQQAASLVKKQYGGKVLRVNKQKSDYNVKLLKPNGHVVSKKVNAKTGQIKKD